MPRLQPQLFRQANQLSPLLATLLPACKDLSSAQNELRWIKSYVDETYKTDKTARLEKFCRQRGRGVPLQYLLGSQPFGSLDIKCRPGVLIPRPETEAYTCHLVDLVKSRQLLGHSCQENDRGLSAVDFCTGTGCIPLLLFSALRKSFKKLNVRGVDVSDRAVRLAKENIAHNGLLGSRPGPGDQQRLTITKGDIFSDKDVRDLATSNWDVIISNPPYISRDVWNHGRGQLGYSVRKYEPRLALIPDDDLPRPGKCNHEDIFYARLLDITWMLKAKAALFEVGDENQAWRVLQLYSQHHLANHSHAEIWRDWPDLDRSDGKEPFMMLQTSSGKTLSIPVKGDGLVRSVLIRCYESEQEESNITMGEDACR